MKVKSSCLPAAPRSEEGTGHAPALAAPDPKSETPPLLPRAWAAAPFWRNVVLACAGGKELYSTHYLETLTAPGLDQLRRALSSTGSLLAQQQLCPRRRGGHFDGALPDLMLLTVTTQLGGQWLRSRFLHTARSEARAYPAWICQCRTTKSLRKKIKQTLPAQRHRYGLSRLGTAIRQATAPGDATPKTNVETAQAHCQSFGLEPDTPNRVLRSLANEVLDQKVRSPRVAVATANSLTRAAAAGGKVRENEVCNKFRERTHIRLDAALDLASARHQFEAAKRVLPLLPELQAIQKDHP